MKNKVLFLLLLLGTMLVGCKKEDWFCGKHSRSGSDTMFVNGRAIPPVVEVQPSELQPSGQ